MKPAIAEAPVSLLTPFPAKTRLQRLAPLALHLLWIPSALILLALILHYSVDVPSCDEWDGVLPYLQKVATGHATLSNLIYQHVEHRMGSMRIISLIDAKVAGWNTRYELVVTWLLACICGWSITVLARRALPGSLWRPVVPVLLGGMLLFGIVQAPLFLNATAMSSMFLEVSLMAGLVVASSPWRAAVRFPICIALATIATYSRADGMATWVVLLPALWLFSAERGRRRLQWAAIWVAAAILMIGRYFWDYTKSPDSPSTLAVFKHPWVGLQFYVATLGSPFSYGTSFDAINVALFVGTILLILYAIVFGYALVHHRDTELLRRMMPFSMIGGYALIAAAGVTVGRVGGGLSQALVFWDLVLHVLHALSLVFLVPVVLEHMVRRHPRISPPLAAGVRATLVTALLFFQICYSQSVLQGQLDEIRANLYSIKTAILFSPCFVEDSILRSNQYLHAGTEEKFHPRAEFLDQHGYIRPRLIRTTRIVELEGTEAQGVGDDGKFGGIDKSGNPSPGVIRITGWAVFPLRHRPADAVILTYETQGHEARVCGIAQMGEPRDNIAERFHNTEYRRCGWIWTFHVPNSPDPITIRAWAFDTDPGKAFELTGSVTLPGN